VFKRVDLIGGGVSRSPRIGGPVTPLQRRIAAHEGGLLSRALTDGRDDEKGAGESGDSGCGDD